MHAYLGISCAAKRSPPFLFVIIHLPRFPRLADTPPLDFFEKHLPDDITPRMRVCSASAAVDQSRMTYIRNRVVTNTIGQAIIQKNLVDVSDLLETGESVGESPVTMIVSTSEIDKVHTEISLERD